VHGSELIQNILKDIQNRRSSLPQKHIKKAKIINSQLTQML